MSDTTTPAAAPRRAQVNRWLAAGLIVSAALNLAFIGWGAVRYVHYSRMAGRPPAGMIEEQITRRMPEHAAEAFRAAIEKNGRLPPHGAFQQFRRDIAAALAAEPYDRAQLAALLDAHRHRLDLFQEGIQSGLLAAADAMTPEERQRYAWRMLRHGPPGPPPPPPGADGPPPK